MLFYILPNNSSLHYILVSHPCNEVSAHARRLWACLVAQPTSPYDHQLAFQLLLRIAHNGHIATADMAAILTECFPSLEPAAMTLKAFECFEYYLQKVGPPFLLSFLDPYDTWPRPLFAAEACNKTTLHSTKCTSSVL